MPDTFIEDFIREIETAPIRDIRDLAADEHVGPCHYSRTGYAIQKLDGACTCEPAEPPNMSPKGDSQ